MGFFQELKEDLSQAVNELIPEEAQPAPMQEMGAPKKADKSDQENETKQPENPQRVDKILTENTNKKAERKEKGKIQTKPDSISNGILLRGDVTVAGALEIYGKVYGKVNAAGAVYLADGAVMIGDIAAKNVIIAGAVKGNIDAPVSVVLEPSAIVMGNIKSESIIIREGAKIEGMCSQCYAKVNPITFFENYEEGGKE